MSGRAPLDGARALALAVTAVTAFALAYVVAFGLFWITSDRSALTQPLVIVV